MRIFFFLIALSLSTLYAQSQNINGTYRALEPLDYRMNEDGSIYYYWNPEGFKHKWFYEVTVTITGNIIRVNKQYTSTDNAGNKVYADSATGTFHYIGTLKKGEGLYYATIHLNNKPVFFPTVKNQTRQDEATSVSLGGKPTLKKDVNTYSDQRYQDGVYYVYDEMMVQDVVLKIAPGGLWINNKLYEKEGNK